MTIIFILALRR